MEKLEWFAVGWLAVGMVFGWWARTLYVAARAVLVNAWKATQGGKKQ